MAQRIRAANMKLLLDIHYSDTWADPNQQAKPAVWATNSFGELLTNAYRYTRDVVSNLAAQGTPPDAVQIVNEITSGFLWDDGHVGGSYETNWDRFCALLTACSRGVRDGAGTNAARVVIHIDAGGNNETWRGFFDRVMARGVPVDVVGPSYYPWWHGPFSALESNVNALAVRFGRDIAVVETGYPWTLTNYDSMGNFVWQESQLQPGYPATPDGQRSFLREVKRILKNAPDHRGIGLYYWAPDYVSVSPIESVWENVATFDNSTNALSSLETFAEHGCESLRAGTVSGGAISLELRNLVSGTTGAVQRADELRGGQWTNVHVFASGGGRTNWTDAPGPWTSAFYRVVTP
jgi:arabinogalactan endo-1,4-beta-galactosidase